MYAKEFGFNSLFEVDIARKAVALCTKGDEFTRIWIKQVDDVNGGAIAVSRIGGNIAFINFLIVLDVYRGKGFAQDLMKQAISHAVDHSYEKVRLETYSCLENARRIYANFGFKLVDYVGEIDKYGQSFDQEFWELDLTKNT